MQPLHVAIVGATGAVGKELLALLEKSPLSLRKLTCFASPKSIGKTITFRREHLSIESLSTHCFTGVDLALFCAGKEIAKMWASKAVAEGALVIDNSSAFRRDANVPLVIPEINPEALSQHRGIIASPNCTTTLMLMALFPLHNVNPIQRIHAATYQAISGAGQKAMDELLQEMRLSLEGGTYQPMSYPYPLAWNLFTHNSPMQENGYVEEELKMVHETHKILNDETIAVHATCVRVPVLRAHSIALHVTCKEPVEMKRMISLLQCAPGICISENVPHMPLDASGQGAVFCSRIRQDLFDPHALSLWVVGDQLLKGAALNVLQIAEKIFLAYIHQ